MKQLAILLTDRRYRLQWRALTVLAIVSPASYGLDFNEMMNPNYWFGGYHHDYYDANRFYNGPNYGPPPNFIPPTAPINTLPGMLYQPYYMPAPQSSMTTAPTYKQNDDEIQHLKRRIEELEATQQHHNAPATLSYSTPPVHTPDQSKNQSPQQHESWGEHVFRPLDQ
jgi:hypothetical protein